MKMKSRLFTTLAASAFAVGSAQAAILVSSGSWNRLYSDTGTMLKSYTETDANYQGNTVDLAGNVYFADFSFGIKKYNGTTGAFIGNTTDNTFFGAAWPLYGISSKGTATPAGDLIASYTLGSNAHFAFLNTGTTNTTGLSPAFGPTYEGINWSKEVGLMYATNSAGVLQVFDGAGNYLTGVGVGTAPKGVVRDDFNDMQYIADFGGSVWRWDGVNAPSVFISGLTNAYGVTAVGNGDIWVSDFGTGNLNRYNSSGVLQSSFNVGANATYITYTTIPEPASMGLLALGLPLLARRRRTRA
jgi:hypothetical protein